MALRLARISHRDRHMAPGKGVSLDELLRDSVAFTADHAAALVGQLCRRVPIDSVEPSDVTFGPEHVWLDRTGEVHLSPGIEPSVPELGRLLALLISEVRRDGSARVPGGLVLVTARATGQLDAAPIVSAERVGGGARAFRASGSTGGAAGPFHGSGGRRHRSARRLWSLTKRCWLLTPRPQLPRLTTTIRRRSPLLRRCGPNQLSGPSSTARRGGRPPRRPWPQQRLRPAHWSPSSRCPVPPYPQPT